MKARNSTVRGMCKSDLARQNLLKIDCVAGNPLKRYVEQTTRWGGRGLSDMSNKMITAQRHRKLISSDSHMTFAQPNSCS